MSKTGNNIIDPAPIVTHCFNGYYICKRQDGIVEIHFDDGFNIDLEDAKRIVSEINEIKGEDKCLLLVVFKDDNSFSMETREYISSDAVSKIIKADAFVMQGLALEILGQGYLRINQPKRPTRLFKSAAVAAMWLMNFME